MSQRGGINRSRDYLLDWIYSVIPAAWFDIGSVLDDSFMCEK